MSRFASPGPWKDAELAEMSLTGAASSTGDRIELTVGDTAYAVQNAQSDGVVDLSKYWNFAEFNVFGYMHAAVESD